MHRLFAGFFSLLVSTTFLAAQPDKVQFERLSLDKGLSQSSVYAIAQDHQGFMWFGTQDGLNRYDGYSFKIFRHDGADTTSISHNYIRRLLVDRDGDLWIGTSNGGVNRYDPYSDRFERHLHKPDDQNSLSDDAIWALFEDRKGLIWIGTNAGLNSYNKHTRVWRRYLAPSDNPSSLDQDVVRSIFEDSSGLLWVGRHNGISTVDPVSGQIDHFQPAKLTVTGFLLDDKGTFWAVGSEIMTYRAGKKMFLPTDLRDHEGRPLPGGNETVLRSRTGDLWFSSYAGLIRMDIRTGTLSFHRNNPDDNKSLSENTPLSLYEDKSGILWVGTYQGLNSYRPTKKGFYHYTHNPKVSTSLSNIRVRGFSEDRDGIVWIATQYGLNRFDPATASFTRYLKAPRYPPSVSFNHFWTVLVDRTQTPVTLWLGTNGGGVERLVFDKRRPVDRPLAFKVPSRTEDPFGLASANVIAAYQDRSGDFWFGHVIDGVSWYHPRNGKTTYIQNDPMNSNSLSGTDICVIFEDSRGAMWFGSYGAGLTRLDRTTMTYTRYIPQETNPASLSDNSVISIHEDTDGFLWFGTYAGLNRFDPATESFRRFTTAHGLANDVIYGIQEDDHENLWLSSNKGLTKFNRRTFEVMQYDVNDGLQDNEFNQGACLRSASGEMYFGGINGFNVFHPDSIRDNQHIPELAIIDFRIFNRSILPGLGERRLTSSITMAKQVSLSYDDAVMTFEFSALEYTNPSRNQYAYLMEGFDEEWNHVGLKREATYTNLDPGSYTFRVKGSNNDGVWNERGASLRITIAPPFWMTWWFRGLLIIGFVSFAGTLYAWRVAVLKKEAAMQREFSRRLIDSQEAERRRIASELHDGLGQDLLVVKNRAALGMRAAQDHPKSREQFQEIDETISSAISDVREIARNLRPYQLDTFGLSEALKATLARVSESSGIAFVLEIDEMNGIIPKEVEINVFRIFQEAANNIVKHSGALKAEFRLHSLPEGIGIEIRDHGKGFDMAYVTSSGKRGLGITGIAERVRMSGGTLEIQSEPGEGTSIRATIPMHLA